MNIRHAIDKSTIDAVANSLNNVELALGSLASVMVPGKLWATAEGASSTPEALKAILDSCRAIDSAGGASSTPPAGCIGVIAGDAKLISAVEAVNQARATFRGICAAVRPQKLRVVSDRAARPNQPTYVQTMRLILSEIGRADLNLRAAYRRFPILAGQPRQVFFCRPGSRSVYKLNRNEILEGLSRSYHPAAGRDLQRMNALPEEEQHLALVGAHYERTRANILFDGFDQYGRHRFMVCCELPIVYPISHRGALPIVKYPVPKERRAITVSARIGKVCKTRFLESLPVHRYLASERGAADRCSRSGRLIILARASQASSTGPSDRTAQSAWWTPLPACVVDDTSTLAHRRRCQVGVIYPLARILALLIDRYGMTVLALARNAASTSFDPTIASRDFARVEPT
jgi:hypothetical protein